MTEFKDDKSKPMDERILAAIDYYFPNGEPFIDTELLKTLDWQPGEAYTKTSALFYPALHLLVGADVIKHKDFDTGEGFDMRIYWQVRRIGNRVRYDDGQVLTRWDNIK